MKRRKGGCVPLPRPISWWSLCRLWNCLLSSTHSSEHHQNCLVLYNFNVYLFRFLYPFETFYYLLIQLSTTKISNTLSRSWQVQHVFWVYLFRFLYPLWSFWQSIHSSEDHQNPAANILSSVKLLYHVKASSSKYLTITIYLAKSSERCETNLYVKCSKGQGCFSTVWNQYYVTVLSSFSSGQPYGGKVGKETVSQKPS